MSNPTKGAIAPISKRIAVIDGQPTTTSRDIAEVFGKQHSKVLSIVRQRMEEAGEWGIANFRDTPYTDPQNGQTYPVIRMTEKGFMFVVQKFTGKKAVAMQIAFVDEFERMRNQLLKQQLQTTTYLQHNRISPSQAQDIKRAVHRVAGQCKLKFAQVWGHLHNKFRVNSYLELQASQFEDVMDYLMGKVDKKQNQQQDLADSDGFVRSPPVTSYFEIPVAVVSELCPFTRWMSQRDSETGQIITSPIANDCYVMNKQQIIKAMANGAFLQGISNDDIFKAIEALQRGLKERLEIERRNKEATENANLARSQAAQDEEF